MFVTTNLGRPEADYKAMYEESLQFLDNYRTNKEITENHYGPEETMEQVWTDVMRELQGEGFDINMYDEARFQTNIGIYEEIWSHENAKAQAKLKKMHDIDLQPLRLRNRESVETLLSAGEPELQTPRSARGMVRQTIDQSWSRHFTKKDGVIVNSRQTKLEMAHYDVNFMNYIFERPLLASSQPEAEIAKQKYYYAVVKGKDYDKILKTGRIPIGRENYYPLNWTQNPVEAFRFMDYLIRSDHEPKGADDGDYRMIALPLDMGVGETRTRLKVIVPARMLGNHSSSRSSKGTTVATTSTTIRTRWWSIRLRCGSTWRRTQLTSSSRRRRKELLMIPWTWM